MMLFPNLSVAEIVGQCSVEVQAKLATARTNIQRVEQKASEVKTGVEQVRSDLSVLDTATGNGTPLHQLASETIRAHREQEQRLAPDIACVELELETVRRSIEAETSAAERDCHEMSRQISTGQAVSGRLQQISGRAAESRQRMEAIVDEAEEMLDRLRALARRQRPEQT